MGRQRTGILTTLEVQRLNIKEFIQDYRKLSLTRIEGSVSWSSGSKINYVFELNNEAQYLRLMYTHTSHSKETKVDYRINLTSIPSNLGKGSIWYFLCPRTGKRCRILYLAYGNPYFMSRTAFQHPIYYQTQAVSKREYHLISQFDAAKKLEELYTKRTKSHYRGRKTRTQQLIEQIEHKKDIHEVNLLFMLERLYTSN